MCRLIAIVSIFIKIIQMAPTQINRGAKFSRCKKHRLQLWRLWDDQLQKLCL